jgi:hypothetical protein
VKRETERSHSEITNRFNISNSHLINARLSLHHSLFQSSNIPPVSTTRHNTGNDFPQDFQNKSYSTLLRLISGSIIGDSSSNEDTPKFRPKDNRQSIPTFSSIAREVENNQGTKLDKKQYVAYEIISCTFLLGLIRDGQDCTSALGSCLNQELSGSDKSDTEDLVEKLKARGGMEQLIMFLTGPAGAGKNTAVTVAQRFCFKFCQAVGILWSDRTFFSLHIQGLLPRYLVV